MKTVSYAALAAALCVAAPAMAQSPAAGAAAVSPPATTAPAEPATSDPAPSAATPSTTPSTSATGAADAQAAGTNASVTTGMSVKDNGGAIIGEVTGVKADASGKNLATIKMGAESFSVETSKLAVTDGAATINASKDDIAKMLKK
ncbi:MAG: hypothetical protein ABW360_10725 [Phenylobacterium sp.]